MVGEDYGGSLSPKKIKNKKSYYSISPEKVFCLCVAFFFGKV
jgi:hypothetical protein